MTNILRRAFRLVDEHQAANDPETVNPHRSLDDLADHITRAHCDWQRCLTALVDIRERAALEIGQAEADVNETKDFLEKANLNFMKRLSEKLPDFEIPLPGHIKGETA